MLALGVSPCDVDDDASEDLVRLVCAPSWRSALVAAAGAPSHTVLEALVAVVEALVAVVEALVAVVEALVAVVEVSAVVASILSRRTNGLSESRGDVGFSSVLSAPGGEGGEGGGDAASPARGVGVKAGAVSVTWLSPLFLAGSVVPPCLAGLAFLAISSGLAMQPHLVSNSAVAVAMNAKKALALRSGPRSG